MAFAFRVRYRALEPGVQGERMLFQLPIRLGRNALNDCQLSHPFVSDFHAVIEWVDGRLCVRDLRSRNGVYSPSGERIGLDLPFALGPIGNAFVLGRVIHVHVEALEQERQPGARLSNTHGAVLGNRAVLETGPSFPPPRSHPSEPRYAAPLPPLSQQGAAMPRPPYVAPANPAWNGVGWNAPNPNSLPGLLPVPPAPSQGAPPGWQAPMQSTPAPAPPVVSRSTQHFSVPVEQLAMLGIKELAGSLVPGVPLETTGDVARLLTKLHDTVEVFCRSFVPLREGYAQFVSSMDLNRAASQRVLNRSNSALAVESARDPATVAAALLDWRNQDYDAPAVIEGVFADSTIHHVALVQSVMQGVQALLHELSPEVIEQSLPGGAVLGRNRALWQAFQARYEELATQARSFELVFGQEFAASYQEYLARSPSVPPQKT